LRASILAAIILIACWTPLSDLPKVVITPVEVSRGGERPAVMFEATGYCNCAVCCDSETGITASGKVASSETVSADWDVLPEGTWVIIEGIGRRVVQDRGAAIRGNRLDVWFEDHAAALDFGRRQVMVKIEEG
jgi:3D (Asp-Asp-Asp) domain-containing protein